ncbi:MAG: hypothetical protein KDD44_02160, partial [Bdellovibrionales bacterium]|nr:hypothetical protein [Bdellovibrionales bacterium]
YVQGLLLYLLAIAFPFFTVFLLMPGRISSFFVWMALWAWVKSWDIGFAFIHIIRDLLWQNTNKTIQSLEVANFNWANPSSVVALAELHDPLTTLNTFFTIIAILTLAVPAFTAHLTMGASQVFNAFKGSMNGQVENFGKRKAKASKNEEHTLATDQAEYWQQRAGIEAAKIAAGDPGMDDEGVQRLMKGDGSVARNVRSAYQLGVYRAALGQGAYGARVQALRQHTAMIAGRRMNYGAIQASRGAIEADTNREIEKFVGAELGTEGYIPFLASEKANWSDSSIGFTDSASFPSDGDDGD